MCQLTLVRNANNANNNRKKSFSENGRTSKSHFKMVALIELKGNYLYEGWFGSIALNRNFKLLCRESCLMAVRLGRQVNPDLLTAFSILLRNLLKCIKLSFLWCLKKKKIKAQLKLCMKFSQRLLQSGLGGQVASALQPCRWPWQPADREDLRARRWVKHHRRQYRSE